MTSKKIETKAVVVTTAHRGVFFGFIEKGTEESKTLALTGARCGIRWRTEGGFIELSEKGPNANSIIGSTAPRIVLHDVTSVTDCTDAARDAWVSHA